MEKKIKTKRKNSFWDIFSSIATTLLLIVSIVVMLITLISSRTLGDNNDNYFLGYKPYIVNSDSMKDMFEAGDIIIVKQIDFEEIKVGDVISYHSIDPTNYYEVLTHEVVEETTYDGLKAFVTKGIMNDFKDSYPAVNSNVIGVYQFRIAKAGYFFSFLKTPAGYVSCILLPFVILLVVQLVNFYKLAKDYKKELENEKRREYQIKDKAHQEEIDEMKKQIEDLKKQIQNK